MTGRNALQIADDLIADKLHRTFGNLQATARALGTTRAALQKRIDESEFLQRALEQAREEMVDIGEAALMQMVAEGHFPAVSFLLQTAGKKRGYTKRSEISGPDGVPLGVDGTLITKIMRFGYDPNDILRAVVAQLEREAEDKIGKLRNINAD